MPDDDLNIKWNDNQKKIELVQEQIKELERQQEELLNRQININDELESKGYHYNFDKKAWVKREQNVIYGYVFKVYVNGIPVCEINSNTPNDDGTYSIIVPSELYNVGDQIIIEPVPITLEKTKNHLII